MKRILASRSIAILAVLHFSATSAQPGRNDPTFNTADDGTWGDGPIGQVHDLLLTTPDKCVIIGLFERYHTTSANKIARIGLDGRLDPAFSSGTGFDEEYPNHPLVISVQADGRLLVGGTFTRYDGHTAMRIVRLLPTGAIDLSFSVGAGPNGAVQSIAVQTDGRILIAGDFTSVDGTPRMRVARLLSNGSVDPSFNPSGGADASVSSVVVQPDGKVLVGGWFTSFNGVGRSCVARLNGNGTVDSSFDPGAGFTGVAPSEGTGPVVRDLELQTDGAIVAVGAFSAYDGAARGSVARLLPDGNIDALFDAGGGTDRLVNTCQLRADGKMLLTGNFIDFGGMHGVIRLDADGALDTSFGDVPRSNSVLVGIHLPDGGALIGGTHNSFGDPTIRYLEKLDATGALDMLFHRGGGFNRPPEALLVLPDNSLLAAGDFLRFNGEPVPHLIRLLPNGARDTGFPIGVGPDGPVRGVARVNDGRLMVFGSFTHWNGTARAGLARLLPDGSLDATFDPGTGATPHSFEDILKMAVLEDGRVLIAGKFNAVNGMPRTGIARLLADGAVDPSFAPVLALLHPFVPNVQQMEVAPEPDGRIWIGGSFDLVNGTMRPRLARLTTSGALDPTFDPGDDPVPTNFRMVRAPDNKLLLCMIGSFNGIDVGCGPVRLLENGSLDPDFNPPFLPCAFGSIGTVHNLMVLPSGQILDGGLFVIADEGIWRAVASFRTDGSLDPAFHMIEEPEAMVNVMAHQPNCCGGKILIAGHFSSYDGIPRHRIARLRNDGSVRLFARLNLEGPWAAGIMRADLTAAGQLPLDEPYTALGFPNLGGGGEQATPSAFMQQGADAVVDWVHVQLRDAQQPASIIATRNALLKADGTITDVDGVSSVEFKDVSNGLYRVAVRHRNHLGAMTAEPQLLLYLGSWVDFTDANLTLFGTGAMKVVDNQRMLWAGDANHDGALKYVGEGNDRDPILEAVGGNVPTNVVTGYKVEDINLDGVVRYVGDDNDRDPILQNIGGNVPTNVRHAQVP